MSASVSQAPAVPASGSGTLATPAKPPTRSEIERKLSFKSARVSESPKKKRSPSNVSGNDSDTSLSSTQGGFASPLISPNPTGAGSSATHPSLPSQALGPPTPGVGGLSAIAERLGTGIGAGEEAEEYEEHDEGDGDGDGSGSEDDPGEKERQGELERGMEGERVLRSGYLYKKQEKRKVWKKKWFVLRTGKLAYYKDDREYSLSRVLDLKTIHTAAPVKIKKHSFTFGIVTKKRTFLCEASSQSEMDEWVNAIVTARRRLTEDGERRERERVASVAGQGTGGGSRQGSSAAKAIPQGTTSEGSGVAHAGTSPIINTSYLNRGSSPLTQSPAQLHPTTGLPGQAGLPINPNAPRVAGSASDQPSLAPPLPQVSSQGSTSLQAGTGTSAPLASSIASQLSKVGIRAQPIVSPVQSPPTTIGRSGFRGGSGIRREPSASSISSAGASVAHGGDYFPRTPSGGYGSLPRNAAASLSPQLGALSGMSSDSEEGDEEPTYFSNIGAPASGGGGLGLQQPTGQSGMPPLSLSTVSTAMGPVDPSRVILSSYLMKRSKGRGRKVWRKRWFILTSQGLTYTKSHMDSKALRHVPMSSILDAIDQSSALDDIDPSSSDSDYGKPSRPTRSASTMGGSSGAKHPSPPQRQLSVLNRQLGPGTPGASAAANEGSGGNGGSGEHTFRLVTAKRNYLLCAPSEEDEIKWLAAFKALLNRERGLSSPVTETAPRLFPVNATGTASAGAAGMSGVPTITQQPPTPAGSLSAGGGGNASSSASGPSGTGAAESGPPASPPATLGGRGRSATYSAKHAVAEVVKRFHPEQHGPTHGQAAAAGQAHGGQQAQTSVAS